MNGKWQCGRPSPFHLVCAISVSSLFSVSGATAEDQTAAICCRQLISTFRSHTWSRSSCRTGLLRGAGAWYARERTACSSQPAAGARLTDGTCLSSQRHAACSSHPDSSSTMGTWQATNLRDGQRGTNICGGHESTNVGKQGQDYKSVENRGQNRTWVEMNTEQTTKRGTGYEEKIENKCDDCNKKVNRKLSSIWNTLRT